MVHPAAATFESLVANAPDFIFLVDQDHRIVYMNRSIPSLPVEQVLGRRADEFVDPGDRQRVRDAIDATFRTRTPTYYESTGPGGEQGETRCFSTRLGWVPVAGDADLVSMVSTDITAQKRADASARRERHSLDAMNRINRVMVGGKDIDGMLQGCLEEMLDIFDCDRAWLLYPCNPSAPEWTVEMERTRPKWPGAAALKAAQPASEFSMYVFETALSDHGAHVFDPSSSGLLGGQQVVEAFGIQSQMLMAIHPKVGEPWCLGIHNCEQTRTYAEQIRLFESIGRRLGDGLTSLLIQKQLVQAQKMEAIGQLTGGVAHDFNNLLTVILGAVELVSMRVGNQSPESKLLAGATTAALRAAVLTERLLAFARKQPLQPSVVDLGALLSGVEDMLRRTLGETVDIEIVSADDIWLCEVDASQLENAILNLTINARDAMPKGGRLRIEATNVSHHEAWSAGVERASGDHVRLAVSDDGTGMPPAVLQRAVEPFFTTKETGQGSGLGLSMVFGFVEQSAGHLQLESEPGRGTSATLFFPRTFEQPPAAEAAGPLRSPRGEGQHVLLVEDEPELRALVVEMLESLGYRPLPVENADQALAVIDGGAHVDLLFTDVCLGGGMNGPELAAAVRRTRPTLPVLYSSGYAADALLADGRLAPGVELLSKPYGMGELAQRMVEALEPTGPETSGAR
jgi:PAS domain S-box-containing protein